MAVDSELYQPGQTDEERAAFRQSFIEEMFQRVKKDYEQAKRFRDEVNQDVVRCEYQYHNAQHLAELRANHEFPVPIGQQLVDQLRATLKDKFSFSGRPCRVIGVEDSDKEDAEAKQDMMDWQDYRDEIDEKIGQGIFDASVRGFACAQVDFHQSYRTEQVLNDVEVPDPRPPMVEKIAGLVGIPPRTKIVQEWQTEEVPDYVGAVVHMRDPHEVYFGPDKRTVGDSFPIMLRSMKTVEYFNAEPFFFNQSQLSDTPKKAGSLSQDTFKEQMTGDSAAETTSLQGCEYIEWQGVVDAAKLAQFEGKPVGTKAYVWCICGVVINQETVVRLESQAHGLNRPNIVIGCLEFDGSVFRPVSTMSKIYGICRGADQAMGQMIDNIVSNIDRAWGIWEDGLTNKSQVINNRGFILTTNRDPRTVIFPLDQQPVFDALAALVAQYYQMAKDATGLQAMSLGQGDPNSETLGESAMIEGPARLGINAYLKTFENTFIQPLYEMRNQVNQMIDLEFRFHILGDKAVKWRTVDPKLARSNVDFVCEASSRETNRAVQTQQAMNFLSTVVPLVQAAGGAVRPELIGKYIAETGMTVSPEVVESWFPMLKLEKDQGLDIGGLMAQSALTQMGVKMAMAQQVGGMLGDPNAQPGNTKGPMTEGAAAESANAQNQVNIAQQV